MYNELKYYNQFLKTKFIFYIFWIFLSEKILSQKELFTFKYSKIFELHNENYLICTEKGIYIYDSDFKNNLSSYIFTTEVTDKNSFEFVSIAQYPKEDGGQIVVLYKNKIYLFEQSGEIIVDTSINLTQNGEYYTLELYKDENDYNFIVGYINGKIFIGYYRFNIEDNSISEIITINPKNDNSTYEGSLIGMSCHIMCSKKFGKVLTCFYEKNNIFGIKSFYISNFSSIDELPTIKNETLTLPILIHSDISEDKSKVLICYLKSSDQCGYCLHYDINEHKISNVVKYIDACSRYPSSLNIFYSKKSKEYIFTCYSYNLNFTIVKFDENFNKIKSDTNIKLAECQVEFVSIIYSYKNNTYSFISSCGYYNDIKLYYLPDIFNPIEKPLWSNINIIEESNSINSQSISKIDNFPEPTFDISSESNKKYYYDEEKQEKIIIEEDQSCPSQFLYENKHSKECLKTCNSSELLNNNCFINNLNNENINIIIQKIRNIINNTYITPDTNIIIEGGNALYQIITSLNMKNNINKNISIIDFGECEKKLKEIYIIEYLLILKIDTKISNNSATVLNYEVYNPATLEKLDLSVCENIKINIYTNYYPSQESLDKFIKLNESGYDLYNINDSFYQDLCTPFTTDNGTDIILSDRKTDYYENISLCEDGCTYKSYNYEIKKVLCECQIKKDIKINTNEIDKGNFFSSFIDADNFSNIKVLKCFKLVFSRIGQSNNIGSYIFLAIIFVLLILAIIFRIYQIKNIIRILRKIINDENYTQKQNENNNINDTLKNKVNIKYNKNNYNENNIDNNIDNNININLNITNNGNDNNKKENVHDNIININNNILSLKNNLNPASPPVKRKRKKKRNTDIINNNIGVFKFNNNINNNNDNNIYYEKKENQQSKKHNSSNSLNSLPFMKTLKYQNNSTSLRKSLMSNYQDIILQNNKKTLIKAEIKQNYYYNDEELNSLSYNDAIKYDKRTYFQYYYSLIKKKHLLFFTFFNNNDYNIFILKFALFLFSFSLYFTVNALFFVDSNVHHIYENQGETDLLLQIPYIFYSTIISSVINLIIKIFALSNKDMLKIKQIKNINEALKESALLVDKLKIKFNIFFIICFLFLNFFWYFISAFCAVYKNTQILLIENTLSSFVLSLIYPLGFNLIPGLIRIPSIRYRFRFSDIIYIFSKIIAYI